jgi:hypothetical protein
MINRQPTRKTRYRVILRVQCFREWIVLVAIVGTIGTNNIQGIIHVNIGVIWIFVVGKFSDSHCLPIYVLDGYLLIRLRRVIFRYAYAFNVR